jgi:hypothetical protein
MKMIDGNPGNSPKVAKIKSDQKDKFLKVSAEMGSDFYPNPFNRLPGCQDILDIMIGKL